MTKDLRATTVQQPSDTPAEKGVKISNQVAVGVTGAVLGGMIAGPLGAIAGGFVSLLALRAADRYGVVKSAKHYREWKALPPPNGDHWTDAEAREFLATLVPAFRKHQDVEKALNSAEFLTHPDRGGNPDDFKKVQRARELLM